MMMIFPRQRVNLFLATFIAGLAGGALGTGYVTLDDPIFALLLGAAVALCGAVQIFQELTQPPVPGSSDLLLGAGQLVAGGSLILFADHGSGFVGPAVSALAIFYALTVLQLAANLRTTRKKFARIFTVAGLVPFVMAVVPFVLPFSFGGLATTLYAACAALAIAAVVVTFLLPFEEQKAKEQAEKLAAAEKKAAKPAPKPLTPEEIAAKEEAARLKAEKAAKEAEARKAAEAARKARQAKEDAEAEQEAMNLLAGLGGLAGKAKKKVTNTAKNTVDGFKQGLNGQDEAKK